MGGLTLSLVVFGFLVVLAVAGVELRRKALLVIGKPAATFSLLLVVGIPPGGTFAWLIAVGVVFALAGDIVLLGDGPRAFMAGLALFLLAHLLYAAGFASGLEFNPHQLLMLLEVGAVVGIGSVTLLRVLWPGVAVGLRLPLILYTSAISLMLIFALMTAWGPLTKQAARLAALGAVLFYCSDANLAWNRFLKPYPHHQTVTLVSYWAGQLGIALAARFSAG